MRRIVVSIALLTAVISAQAQGCGSVEKGMRAVNLNKVDEAKELFEKASQEIKDAEANNQPLEAKCYARYYYGAGHTALQVYQRSDSEDLVSKVAMLHTAEEFFTEFFALDYQDKSYHARAITDLEAVANQQKNIAVDYFNKGDFEQALNLLDKCIENKAKLGVNHLDLHAYQSASITANRVGDYAKAIKYNDVLIANPQLKINNKVNDQEYNLVKKSEYLNNAGEVEKALSVLDSAQKVFPNSLPVRKKKLQIYTEINDDDSALELLEDLTQTVKDDVKYFVIMGRIYNNKGFSQKSYDAYKTALSIDPKNKYAIFGMGAYYVNKSNEYVNSLNGVGNSESDKVAKSATVEEQNKNFDKAIFYFNQYLEIEPGDRGTLNALKKIYKAKGDDAKVEEINKQLIAE